VGAKKAVSKRGGADNRTREIWGTSSHRRSYREKGDSVFLARWEGGGLSWDRKAQLTGCGEKVVCKEISAGKHSQVVKREREDFIKSKHEGGKVP